MGPFPASTNTKIAIWRHLLSFQNEAISLVPLLWQEVLTGLEKSRHCQTWIKCNLPWNKKSERKQKLNCKMYKSNTKYWKYKSDFVIGAALRAEKDLYVSLKIASFKKAVGKTCCGRRHGDVGGHLVGALDKWSFGDGGNFCALRLVILHCIWDVVGEIVFIMSPNLLTPSGLFSYQTVSSFVTLDFGYWKNAVQNGFSFSTNNFRLAKASSSASVL